MVWVTLPLEGETAKRRLHASSTAGRSQASAGQGEGPVAGWPVPCPREEGGRARDQRQARQPTRQPPPLTAAAPRLTKNQQNPGRPRQLHRHLCSLRSLPPQRPATSSARSSLHASSQPNLFSRGSPATYPIPAPPLTHPGQGGASGREEPPFAVQGKPEPLRPPTDLSPSPPKPPARLASDPSWMRMRGFRNGKPRRVFDPGDHAQSV